MFTNRTSVFITHHLFLPAPEGKQRQRYLTGKAAASFP